MTTPIDEGGFMVSKGLADVLIGAKDDAKALESLSRIRRVSIENRAIGCKWWQFWGPKYRIIAK